MNFKDIKNTIKPNKSKAMQTLHLFVQEIAGSAEKNELSFSTQILLFFQKYMLAFSIFIIAGIMLFVVGFALSKQSVKPQNAELDAEINSTVNSADFIQESLKNEDPFNDADLTQLIADVENL